jgi:hypothetical protein
VSKLFAWHANMYQMASIYNIIPVLGLAPEESI